MAQSAARFVKQSRDIASGTTDDGTTDDGTTDDGTTDDGTTDNGTATNGQRSTTTTRKERY